MANANRPTGFSPVKYLNGANWDSKGQIYSIDSSDTNTYCVGDPVKLTGTGSAGTGIPGVTRATAGATFVGIFMGGGIFAPGGPYVNPAALDSAVIPATKLVNYYCLVIDDPNVIFEAQEDGVGGTLAVTDIGNNVDMIAANVAANTRVSGFMIDSSTTGTGTTVTWKILRLAPRIDNALGANAKWWVLPNNHSFRAGIAGL